MVAAVAGCGPRGLHLEFVADEAAQFPWLAPMSPVPLHPDKFNIGAANMRLGYY